MLVPLGADQPDNAERGVATGAARVLAADGLTPEAVREAIGAVLREPSYREHAWRLRAEMEALPDVEQGIHRLEQLARNERPLARPATS